eukprot:2470225-Rhodomonas_salina.1
MRLLRSSLLLPTSPLPPFPTSSPTSFPPVSLPPCSNQPAPCHCVRSSSPLSLGSADLPCSAPSRSAAYLPERAAARHALRWSALVPSNLNRLSPTFSLTRAVALTHAGVEARPGLT